MIGLMLGTVVFYTILFGGVAYVINPAYAIIGALIGFVVGCVVSYGVMKNNYD